MEKRYGNALIAVQNKLAVTKLNELIGSYSGLVVARQGIPQANESLNLISLILYGNMQQINALAGKLGRLDGIIVKISVLPPF